MNNIYLFVSIKSYQTILYTKVCTESKGRLLLYQDLNMAGIRRINHYVQVPTRVASHHLLQGRERKESKVSAFQGWEKSHYNIADYHISVIISQGIPITASFPVLSSPPPPQPLLAVNHYFVQLPMFNPYPNLINPPLP